MKIILQISIVIFCLSTLSCTHSDNRIPTIVKGKARDVARNIPSPGLKVFVYGYGLSSSTNFGGLAGFDFMVIDSTVTDVTGNFEMEFNHKPDYTHYLGFADPFPDTFNYYADVIADSAMIVQEEVNIRDVNAWKPVVLQLELSISNNTSPDLIIQNETLPRNDYFFGAIIVHEQQIDTTVYLPAKPNAEHRIGINYKTGPHNEVNHTRYEFLQTALQDTLKINYMIDCSTF